MCQICVISKVNITVTDHCHSMLLLPWSRSLSKSISLTTLFLSILLSMLMFYVSVLITVHAISMSVQLLLSHTVTANIIITVIIHMLMPLSSVLSLLLASSFSSSVQTLQFSATSLPTLIDLFHNGGQIKYSFVLMLISLTSLAMTSKFQKNICFKTRAVGLINIKTKHCKSDRHL